MFIHPDNPDRPDYPAESTRERRDKLAVEEQRKAGVRKLMAEHLQMAYEPPPAELATGVSTYGWPAVVKLVEHWINNPAAIPQPMSQVTLNYKVQDLNAEQLQTEFEEFLTTAGIKYVRVP
jgi:hypothetical protein